MHQGPMSVSQGSVESAKHLCLSLKDPCLSLNVMQSAARTCICLSRLGGVHKGPVSVSQGSVECAKHLYLSLKGRVECV